MALAGGGAKSINFQALASDLAQITFDYPFRIPPYFALIIRAIGVLEGIALVREEGVLSAVKGNERGLYLFLSRGGGYSLANVALHKVDTWIQRRREGCSLSFGAGCGRRCHASLEPPPIVFASPNDSLPARHPPLGREPRVRHRGRGLPLHLETAADRRQPEAEGGSSLHDLWQEQRLRRREAHRLAAGEGGAVCVCVCIKRGWDTKKKPLEISRRGVMEHK